MAEPTMPIPLPDDLARLMKLTQWQAGEIERLRERVPADVALARVVAMANEPDFAERHVQLGKFYAAANTDELIDAMEAHIAKLQAKVQALTPAFSFAPTLVREG